jgi:hypothetical protein
MGDNKSKNGITQENLLFVIIKEPERGFMYLSKGELSESS